MVSSGMLHRVALVRTDVSEEPGASFIRVTRIGELGTTQAATSNRRTLRNFFAATWRNIPEDTILHSHHRENFKSYIPVSAYTFLLETMHWTSMKSGKKWCEPTLFSMFSH
jgi:hypothetical protein